MANINWYPGHMTKAKRMMAECLPLIDVAIELVDPRIHFSSKNPDIAKMTENKPKFIVLNKSDLSDPVQNEKWLKYYANTGYTAVLFDSKTKNRTASSGKSEAKERIVLVAMPPTMARRYRRPHEQ